jgi:hypothetical protein
MRPVPPSRKAAGRKGEVMGQGLTHEEIAGVISTLSEAKIVDLDASIRTLVEPLASHLKGRPGGEVSIHVLCCNEYVLVTGLTGGPLGEIREGAAGARRSLEG